MCLCVCVSLIKFEWSYTSEGVSFKYDRMEYECVSFKSNVTFKVLVEFVRLVESGVLVVSECVVFISYELGVSSMCECVCDSRLKTKVIYIETLCRQGHKCISREQAERQKHLVNAQCRQSLACIVREQATQHPAGNCVSETSGKLKFYHIRRSFDAVCSFGRTRRSSTQGQLLTSSYSTPWVLSRSLSAHAA